MKSTQAPGRRATLGAFASLAVAAWLSPALAATGADTRCDRSGDAPTMPDVGTSKLAIDVVDHGVTDVVAGDDISLDAPLGSADPAGNRLDIGSPVDVTLRSTFDAPRLRVPHVSDAQEPDEMSTPVASDKSDIGEEAASTTEDGKATEVVTGLPSVSDEELLRFRQQMYRTDI